MKLVKKKKRKGGSKGDNPAFSMRELFETLNLTIL